MTNWCKNILVVTGDKINVSKFKKQAVGYWPWDKPEPGQAAGDLNFHSIVPMPETVIEAGYESAARDWQIANWGCRGGAVLPRLESDNGYRLDYLFETPCSPPLKWLKQASSLWPALLFELSFLGDMPNYRGEATARAGELTSQVDTEFGEALKRSKEDGGVDEELKRTKAIPADPEVMNERRAEWAAVALSEFRRETGADIGDAASDLLADLMHWCDRNEQDFEEELRRARMHYEFETAA